jgi:NAD(P)-dependent dehydrogenase (short-subunit alcohol dehydrogenase family)
MPGRVEGKVAFITGAGRGQGRSHAIRLAEEAFGRRIVAAKADVRDATGLRAALDAGVAELGRLDIVCANAGVYTVQPWDQVTWQVWQDTIDTNLTGVWNTMVVAVPHLIAADGGSIIATSSTAGLKGMPFLAPYVAAKHAVVGICRSLANELAVHQIRVNTVHPAGVDTPMVVGPETLEPFLSRSPELGAIFTNALPVEALDPRDVSNAVLWLAWEEARYVTGAALTVDAGNTIR